MSELFSFKSIKAEKYNIDALLSFLEQGFNKYLKEEVTDSDIEEQEKEQGRRNLLRTYSNESYAGEEKDRDFMKQFIKRFITTSDQLLVDGYPDNYHVTRNNIDKFLNLKNPEKMDAYLKFIILLNFYKKTKGKNAFAYLIEKYAFNKLRVNEYKDKGFFITAKDIHEIYEKENIEIDYNLHLDIIVQLLYEEFKGNLNIDELLYQNIDDVQIGVSGLQSEVVPPHLANKNYPYAYEGCWIKYKGALIHLRFISLRSFENLKKIVKQGVSYQQKGQFSESEGFKLGYGKDGSRRTAAITPFGESTALWTRKFTVRDLNNAQLVLGNNEELKGAQDLIRVETALVKAGATIPICGGQGAGKTTKLEALCEYTQNFFALRMIESEFETRIRWRYPNKNIYTVQEIENVDAAKAYEFSLRTSGDIYIVSEARSDAMVVNITRTANRGGRSVLFTYHPNVPQATILEIANALLRERLYTNLKDAMYTALNTIKCCIQINVDFENNCRYYNIYEFIPVTYSIDNAFIQLEGKEKQNAFMNTMYSYFVKATNEEYFKTVPIITFDREKQQYDFHNNISDRFFEELYYKSVLMEEKRELEKIFRPGRYIKRYLQQNQKTFRSQGEIDMFCKKNNLNTHFLNYEDFINLGEAYG